jgi:hypothetical protein
VRLPGLPEGQVPVTRAQLEWRLVYALVVAGKSARFANGAVKRLQEVIPRGCLRIPILFLGVGEPGPFLRAARTGNYGKLEAACRALREAGLDLFAVTPEELERIPGIGPKTSRFFVTWTRPWEKYAVLDRHVLRWLRERGHPTPSTPPGSGRLYGALEAIYLREAEAAGKTPRGLDLEIWRAAATADNVVEDVE